MKYILLALLLTSCSSKVYVTDCKHVKANVYQCEK